MERGRRDGEEREMNRENSFGKVVKRKEKKTTKK
jgi:hypothetical protein